MKTNFLRYRLGMLFALSLFVISLACNENSIEGVWESRISESTLTIEQVDPVCDFVLAGADESYPFRERGRSIDEHNDLLINANGSEGTVFEGCTITLGIPEEPTDSILLMVLLPYSTEPNVAEWFYR